HSLSFPPPLSPRSHLLPLSTPRTPHVFTLSLHDALPISPRSVCNTGLSPGRRVASAWSSMVLTISALGRVPMLQVTTIPSKQSIIGERYTFPAGRGNSVISVTHFLVGAAAEKQRARTRGPAGQGSPREDAYWRRLRPTVTRPPSRMRRRTTFSEMVMPSRLRTA